MPRVARASFLLPLLALSGCGPSPSPAHPPRPSPAAGSATDAELAAACDDLRAFRALAIREASGTDRAALERWAPPHPVTEGDRPAVTAVVRRWVGTCAGRTIVELATQLIRFPTVASEQPPAEGPSFRDMAAFLRRWAEGTGLTFRVTGANDAWEITLGQGPRHVAYVMHADVVPAGEAASWSVPPFEGTLRDGKLWGRGAEDDKGPIAAVLVVMSMLAQSGLLPAGQVLAVMGTAEEEDWEGMRRYAQAAPHARFTVSLDASFPVVIAESGFVAFRIAAPLGARRRPGPHARVVDAHAGNFLTQVPGDAHLILEPGTTETVDALLARASAAAAQESARGGHFGASTAREGDRVVVRATGRAVHSSQADEGENALWALSSVAARLDLEPGGVADLLRVVHDQLDGDHWGERLGLAHTHPVMGPLLVTPTMLRVEREPGTARAVLSINMRRPAGMSAADFGARLDAVLVALRRSVSPRLLEAGERHVGEPHLADTSGPLVETLLDVYRSHAGPGAAAAQPISIRGGTYARLFPGAVSFGPELPGRPYRGHAPDEWVETATLDLYARMIFDATLRLDAAASAATP